MHKKEHGAKGEVVGPNSTAPDTKLMVKFPANKSAVGCLVAELGRSRDSTPRLLQRACRSSCWVPLHD